jgi:HAD superfamily hydrolase (TIGR01509 family)
MIRAALFDLDGTLQDSEVLWVEATRDYLHDQGAEVSHAEAEQIVYGRGWREVFETMKRLAPPLAPVTMNEGARVLRRYYLKRRDTTTIALPGSVDLLRRLAKRMPVAIVSGSPRDDIAEAIDHLGIRDSVQFFLGAEDYAAGKPSPDCFLLAAERLKLPPATCLVLEDSAAGVTAAKAAGMPVVALVRPGRPRQHVVGADWIVPDLAAFDMENLKTHGH